MKQQTLNLDDDQSDFMDKEFSDKITKVVQNRVKKSNYKKRRNSDEKLVALLEVPEDEETSKSMLSLQKQRDLDKSADFSI